jgi:hypothetical protein
MSRKGILTLAPLSTSQQAEAQALIERTVGHLYVIEEKQFHMAREIAPAAAAAPARANVLHFQEHQRVYQGREFDRWREGLPLIHYNHGYFGFSDQQQQRQQAMASAQTPASPPPPAPKEKRCAQCVDLKKQCRECAPCVEHRVHSGYGPGCVSLDDPSVKGKPATASMDAMRAEVAKMPNFMTHKEVNGMQVTTYRLREGGGK